MNSEDISVLLAVHHELALAAALPEACRPYDIRGRLEQIQKLIMEKCTPTTSKTDKTQS